MADPATLDEYNAKAMANSTITGFGADMVTHFPCPGCAAPGWMDFPITASLNDYRDVQDPASCSECGRTFRFKITQTGGGAAAGGSTEGTFVQVDGPDVPSYLPPMLRESA